MLVFPMKRAFLNLSKGGNIQETSVSQVAPKRGDGFFCSKVCSIYPNLILRMYKNEKLSSLN